MPLPINKQPVVRPGNKMTSFGWPFHGKVTDSGTTGTLPLDPPASPSTKTFTAIRKTVVEVDLSSRYYHNWNVTNINQLQRPGWTVPTRSAEQLTNDANNGFKWKPYMTEVGPHHRLSGASGTEEFKWNNWVYIDGNGAAYRISFTHVVNSSTELEFTFRISELVVTVTRDPQERVVTGVLLNTSPLTFFSDFFKMVIMDRTPLGDKIMLHLVPSNTAIFWDTVNDLPKQQTTGGVSEVSADFEIQVTGNGIDNIAFTANKDPFDEKVLTQVSPLPNFQSDEVIAFFYDGAGVRQPVTRTITQDVSNFHVLIGPGNDIAIGWTSDTVTTVNWGGLYSSVLNEQTDQIATAGSPITVTQDRYIEGNLVDSNSGNLAVNTVTAYDTTNNVFTTAGSGPLLGTAVSKFTPWLGTSGERIRRIAQGYLLTTSNPASGTAHEDVWLDKKNGTVIASLSGWAGGITGFYEFAAYDPETAAFDSVVFSAGALPVPPAAFDLKWYV